MLYIEVLLPSLPVGNNPVVLPQPRPIKKVKRTKIRRKIGNA